MKCGLVMPLAEQRGGAEMFLMHLLRSNAHHRELELTLAFLEDGPLVAEAQRLGYETFVTRADRLRDIRTWVTTVSGLTNWLRGARVDMVLSWMAKAHLYAGPAAIRAGVPASWFQHCVTHGHWLDRIATRLPAAKVLCCSRTALEAQRLLKPVREMTVVYPAVDTARFDAAKLPTVAQARERAGLPVNVPIIGIVCRLQRWKGVHIVLEAFTALRDRGVTCHCVVVGGVHSLEPDYLPALQRIVAENGIADSVTFAGATQEVPNWMQAMDIVVHASVEREAFGMVVIEAMALSKVVVGARPGGPEEIITEGVDGFLVPAGDSAALSAALERCLANLPSLNTVREAARVRAAHFEANTLAKKLATALGPASNAGRHAGRV